MRSRDAARVLVARWPCAGGPGAYVMRRTVTWCTTRVVARQPAGTPRMRFGRDENKRVTTLLYSRSSVTGIYVQITISLVKSQWTQTLLCLSRCYIREINY